jgi:hypothetical protein
MRSLYPLRVVVLVGLFAWLVIKAIEKPPLPDCPLYYEPYLRDLR